MAEPVGNADVSASGNRRPTTSAEITALDVTPENESWCPDHGYGCESSNCPCGHTVRCDCRSIADEH